MKMAEEKNPKPAHRPKVFKDIEWRSHSIFISASFQKNWKKILDLSQIDNDPNFQAYCKGVENADLSKKAKARLNIYVRWILSTHALKNQHKLVKND